MQNITQQVEIIFENQDFLCIDKPAGLIVHSDGRTEEESLSDWLKLFSEKNNLNLENIGNPHTLDSGRYERRLGIVNRLDRDTAGLILIAKNEDTFAALQKLFMLNSSTLQGWGSGGISKKYLALVWGKIDLQKLVEENKIFRTEKENIYLIKEKITRHKKDPRVWTCGFTSAEGGRQTGLNAETLFSILSFDQGQTLVNLYPKTGRTHQLRLHLRFLGHPIVGDDKYGLNGKINEHSIRQIENLMSQENLEQDKNQKLKLIAKSLEFELNGEKYFLESKSNFDK